MKTCLIYGGGTFSPAKCHLALAAPAFGTTARQLYDIFRERCPKWVAKLRLTKMADYNSNIVTNEDLVNDLLYQLQDRDVKAVIMNAALCDFNLRNLPNEDRLSSKQEYTHVVLEPDTFKVIDLIKRVRPDVKVVAFKTTMNQDSDYQVAQSRELMKDGKVDIVVANDVGKRNNLLISPYALAGGSRQFILGNLVWNINNICKDGNTFEAFKCYQ